MEFRAPLRKPGESSRKLVEQVNHFAWKSVSLVANARAHVRLRRWFEVLSGSQRVAQGGVLSPELAQVHFARGVGHSLLLLCLVRFNDLGACSEPRMDPSLNRSCRCIAERGRTGAQNEPKSTLLVYMHRNH